MQKKHGKLSLKFEVVMSNVTKVQKGPRRNNMGNDFQFNSLKSPGNDSSWAVDQKCQWTVSPKKSWLKDIVR